MASPMITSPGPVQHKRRIGSPGMPPALLPGQIALNDPQDGQTLARLYGGVGTSPMYQTGVAILVSSERQVELTGEQTIVGDKTIAVENLHVTGGSHGDVLVTDGLGGLEWTSGGGGVFPEAPTDGAVYGREGLNKSWVPVLPLSGGTITGNVFVDGSFEVNGDGVVVDAPLDGKLYVRGNGTWIILPWEWPGEGGTGMGGGGFPEAPPTGIIYGRDGQSQSWVPVLPLSGGSMLGTLILNGPPNAESNPNQAATVGYVNSLLTGALQFIGVMDASTNLVNYTNSSGIPDGPLLPAVQVPDRYVVVTVGGVLNSPPEIAGTPVQQGDWLISDGSSWNVISIPTSGRNIFASQVIVDPPIAGQDDAQAALTALLNLIAQNAFPEAPTDGQSYGRVGLSKSWTPNLPISGGTMLGNLILNGPPTNQSNPNQAATKGYVDGLIMGALEFLGTMDASQATARVTYTIASGITPNPGPLVDAPTAKDQYVIVSIGGTIAGAQPEVNGKVVKPGDWLISDGVTWYIINVSSSTILASNVTVGPAVVGQTNVQGALEALASMVGQLQSQVASFINSVSTIGDVASTGSAH